MKVGVVFPPGANLAQPAAVIPLHAAELHLDDGVDEDARHSRILRRELYQAGLPLCPDIAIQCEFFPVCKSNRFKIVTLAPGALVVERQPDIGIKPVLVADVPARHWPSAWLAHIRNQHQSEFFIGDLFRQLFEVLNQAGVSIVAIAGQPYDLVTASFRGHAYTSSEAADGIAADGIGKIRCRSCNL